MGPDDVALIRALQDEALFLTAAPFEEAARRLGLSCEQVLARVRELREAGVIRRFGAALTPRNAGFSANSMVVWEMDDAQAEEAAPVMAAHPRVSHCYIRPRFEGFPFNVYTMVHANSPQDLQAVIGELSASAGGCACRALHSQREFKKSSPVYFPEALEPSST